jgi:hypothetical protein
MYYQCGGRRSPINYCFLKWFSGGGFCSSCAKGVPDGGWFNIWFSVTLCSYKNVTYMLQRETNNPVFIGALKFFFPQKPLFPEN